MKIVVLGSGSIVPTAERFGSGLLLEDRSAKIGVDPGPGFLEKLRSLGMSPKSVDAFFITHFHLDHVADLSPLLMMWAYDEQGMPSKDKRKLKLVGPQGLSRLVEVIASEAFPYLSETMGCDRYTFVEEMEDGGHLQVEGIRAVAAKVEHFNGLAYRFETSRCSVVFSGDTIPDEKLVKLAKGCDVLIHECSFPSEKMVGKHTSEEQLAQLAAKIRPRILVATHLYPVWRGLEERIERAVSGIGLEMVVIARDMTVIEI
ncbi:MAG: MBL fold metallo-hydrolase [Candidatus Caldarchaeum sp.]|nr:MBL fold metallo-hydrolase [Candidatus Caldarchaeum sp.]